MLCFSMQDNFYHKRSLASDKEVVVIEGFCKPFVEAPLYIFGSQVDDEFTYNSMIFKRKSSDKYELILSNYDGKIVMAYYITGHGIVYDNIGRADLPTPYSGSVYLSLRSNKYHHSTMASHVSDLYEILKDSSKTSTMLFADVRRLYPYGCC